MPEKNLNSSQPYNYPVTLSIQTGYPNQFAYSPFFDPAHFYTQIILMSGSRSSDRRAIGGRVGDGYNCHHIFETNFNGTHCHAQLVPQKIHYSTIPHMGAVAQWNHRYPNNPYRKTLKDNITIKQYDIYINSPYTLEDVQNFQNKFNIKFPDILVDVYTGKSSIKGLYETSNGEIVDMESLLPLFEDEEKGYVGIETLLKNKKPFKYTKFNESNQETIDNNYLGIAIDACGNFLFINCSALTYYFYDHETDMMYSATSIPE